MADIPGREGTNITETDTERFAALRDPRYTNFALFSVFFDGEPTHAIVAVEQGEGGNATITPLYVALTDDLAARLTDHEGQAPD